MSQEPHPQVKVIPPNEPEWRVKLRQSAEALSGRQLDIARILAEPAGRDQSHAYPPQEFPVPQPGSRLETFGWRGDIPLAEFFRSDGDLYQALAALVGKDQADLASRLFLHRNEKSGMFHAYPGPDYNYMPSFLAWREAASPQFGENDIDYLQAFVGDMAEGYSMDKYFAALDLPTLPMPNPEKVEPAVLQAYSENRRATDKYRRTGDPLLEYYLDDPSEAPALLTRIEEIPDRQSRFSVVKVLVKSTNLEAHRLAAELIVDPAIPDEKRFVSVRAGRREAFQTILNRIWHSEIAISRSGVQAMCGWLGLNLDNLDPEQSGAFFELGDLYRQDQDKLQKALRSDQHFWIYLALWVLSQENVDTAMAACLDRVQNGTRLQKHLALFFADKLNTPDFKVKIANAVFANSANQDDATCLALTVNLLLNTVNGGRYFMEVLNDGMQLALSMEEEKKGISPSPNSRDVRQLYTGLKETADRMLAANHRDRGGHFGIAGRHSSAFTLDDVFALMSDIASRDDERNPTPMGALPKDDSGVLEKWGVELTLYDFPITYPRKPDLLDAAADGNIRDELCQYVPHMGKEVLRRFIKQVVRDGSASPAQRQALIYAYGKIPETVWRYTSTMPFSDAECQVLEDALATGDAITHRLINIKLLLREPEGLGCSVKRLLVSPDGKKRAAGRELLDIMERNKNTAEYRDIYRECQSVANGDASHAALAGAYQPGQDDGFGLYDPAQPKAHFDLTGFPDIIARDVVDKFFPTPAEEILRLIEIRDRVIAANPGKIVRERSYTMDPSLVEALREAFRQEQITSECLVDFAGFPYLGSGRPNPIKDSSLFKRGFQLRSEVHRRLNENAPEGRTVLAMANKLDAQIVPPRERYRLIRPLTLAVMSISLDQLHVDGYAALGGWIRRLEESAVAAADFTDFFRIMYEWTSGRDGNSLAHRLITPAAVVRGYQLKILPENDFVRMLVQLGDDGWLFYDFTDPVRSETLLRDAPEFRSLVNRIATRAAEMEAGRGELPTRLTNLAGSLRGFDCSAELFARLLVGLGDAKLDPHYDWERTLINSGSSRRAMLTRLLLSSRPAPGETAATLASCLEGKGICRERLEEVAEFVPVWRSYIFVQ